MRIDEAMKKKLKANGIPAKIFRQRVSINGWSPEKASTTPIRPKVIDRKTKAELQKRNIPPVIFRQRLKYGWSREEAMTTPVRDRKDFSQELEKKLKENGISKSAYYQRIEKYGWDKEKASTKPIHKKK